MIGKIIAIVGGPRSGKSFLAKKLADHYAAKLFLEGEDADFPERIKEDIAKNIRPLERILWFRNTLVSQYLNALELRKKGEVVVLDVFWLGPKLFIDILLQDDFEKEVTRQILDMDEQMLGMPDVLLHLKISEYKMREFLRLGAREFDQSEEFIKNQALPVAKMWEDFCKNEIALKDSVLTIDRSNIDFSNQTDFLLLTAQVDSRLRR